VVPRKSARAAITLANTIPGRDTTWWHTVEALGAAEDRANEGAWRHAQIGPRPWTWDRALADAFGDDWKFSARGWNPSSKSDRDNVVSKLYKVIGVEPPEKKSQTDGARVVEPVPVCKKARTPPPRSDAVHAAQRRPTVQAIGDSQLVINWVNGAALCVSTELRMLVADMRENMHALW